MRLKVAAFILLAGLLALALLFGLKKSSPYKDQTNSTQVVSSPEESTTNLAQNMSPKGSLPTGDNPPRLNAPTAQAAMGRPESRDPNMTNRKIAHWSTPAEKTAYIQSTIRKLEDLSTENDSVSFEGIVSELTNSIKTIREAAREAAVQFGDRDAISRLKEAAATVEDPREKVAFLDAAELLALPTLTEHLAQPQTNGPVLRPPNRRGRLIKESQVLAAPNPGP